MARRTSRARSVPASRATRCSAMSMPAETPALVMRSPSSTKRAVDVGHHRRVELGQQVQRRPVRRRRPARQQSGSGVDEASRAHRGHQRNGGTLGAHPVQVLGVAEQGSGALAARVDEDVEGRGVVEGVVGAQDQALGASDVAAVGGQARDRPSRPRGGAGSSTRGPPRDRRRRAPRRRRRAAARCGAATAPPAASVSVGDVFCIVCLLGGVRRLTVAAWDPTVAMAPASPSPGRVAPAKVPGSGRTGSGTRSTVAAC